MFKKKLSLPSYTYSPLNQSNTSTTTTIRTSKFLSKMSLTLFGLTILFSTVFLSSQAQHILFPVNNKNALGFIEPLDHLTAEKVILDNNSLSNQENKVKIAIIGGGAGG